MADTSSRRRLTPEARRGQLLDVAVELGAGQDLASVSTREIARRAGVSEGLLFHYFPTKQAIVAAAVGRAAEAMLEDLAVGSPGGPPREQLEAALDAYLAHVVAHPTGWRLLWPLAVGRWPSWPTRSNADLWRGRWRPSASTDPPRRW